MALNSLYALNGTKYVNDRIGINSRIQPHLMLTVYQKMSWPIHWFRWDPQANKRSPTGQLMPAFHQTEEWDRSQLLISSKVLVPWVQGAGEPKFVVQPENRQRPTALWRQLPWVALLSLFLCIYLYQGHIHDSHPQGSLRLSEDMHRGSSGLMNTSSEQWELIHRGDTCFPWELEGELVGAVQGEWGREDEWSWRSLKRK